MRLVAPPCWTVRRLPPRTSTAPQTPRLLLLREPPSLLLLLLPLLLLLLLLPSPLLLLLQALRCPAVDAHATIMSNAVISLLAIVLAGASAQGLPASLPNVWGGNASAPAGGVLGGCSGQLFGFCTSEL